MTREQAMELAAIILASHPFEQSWRFHRVAQESIALGILAVATEENEACAKIAADAKNCDDIAALIRARLATS